MSPSPSMALMTGTPAVTLIDKFPIWGSEASRKSTHCLTSHR
jgi:hypothetical protein